jgi:hypothetical protein
MYLSASQPQENENSHLFIENLVEKSLLSKEKNDFLRPYLEKIYYGNFFK